MSEEGSSSKHSPVSEKSATTIEADALPIAEGEDAYVHTGKSMRRVWLKMDLFALPVIVIFYVLNVLVSLAFPGCLASHISECG